MFWFTGNSQVDGLIAIISISLQTNQHDKQCSSKLVEPKHVTDTPKCVYLMKNSQAFSVFCRDLMTLLFIKKMRVSFNLQNVRCIFIRLNRAYKKVNGIFPVELVFLPRVESQFCKITQAANIERLVIGTGEKSHLIFGLFNRLQIKQLKTLQGVSNALHQRRYQQVSQLLTRDHQQFMFYCMHPEATHT